MSDNEFGTLIRTRRTALRLSLRAFAEAAGMDPGNASRMERGQLAPPEALDVLHRIAAALKLKKKSREYEHLFDVAAAAKGRVPADLLSDSEVAAKLPILFRTLRSKSLTKEKLEKLIESIRKA
jgi:transcriptional regulator with XRE-family HTH domain